MKVTNVTAALIWQDGKVLLARRSPGEKHAGGWEFPGGKQENDESKEDCLKRELREELGIEAEIGERFVDVSYEYPDGMIFLSAYHVVGFSGEISLHVHDKLVFLDPGKIQAEDILPADREIADQLKRCLDEGR